MGIITRLAKNLLRNTLHIYNVIKKGASLICHFVKGVVGDLNKNCKTQHVLIEFHMSLIMH